MERRLLAAMCCCLVARLVGGHREHKVHNIVLYPDKHSWCNTTPIKQVVAFPGCSSVEIDNNVCVGACFSYSIPRTAPSAPGELIKPYCDSCQPSTVAWQHVTLNCTGEDTESLQKRVQIIRNCSCSTCDAGDDIAAVSSVLASGDGEIGTDHKASLPDVGDLIDFMLKTQNKGPAAGVTGGESGEGGGGSNAAMNERLLLLLRTLGEGGQLDEADLCELLRQADHKLNAATHEHRDHIKVNLERLRHELAHHRHHQHQQDPTLSVAPHHFKPALGGAELSYHDNLLQPEEKDEEF